MVLITLRSVSANWGVRLWTASPELQAVQLSLTAAVKRTMDDAMIGIPLPQMDAWMKEPPRDAAPRLCAGRRGGLRAGRNGWRRSAQDDLRRPIPGEHLALGAAPMNPEDLDALRTVIVAWTPGFLVAVACAGAVAMVWARVRRIGTRSCPGPRESASLRRPGTWLRRPLCGYDLTGLIAMDYGYVRCPECGTLVQPGARRWFRAAWRFEVIAPVCLLAALVCRNASYLHGGRWLQRMPSPVLLALESAVPTGWSHFGRWALRDRLFAHELAGWETRWLRGIAVAQLGDDTIDGNADWAIEVLRDMGDEAISSLEAALNSADWQRRQIAASLLRARCNRHRHKFANEPLRAPYEPTERLFTVTVEGLRDDDLPYARVRGRETFLSNGFDGLEFLAAQGQRAARACDCALDSDEPQQRFLAAAALGLMGSSRSAGRAAPILAAHLFDNGIGGDAGLSLAALEGLGPDAEVALAPCLSGSDAQAGVLADAVVSGVRGVSLTRVQRASLTAIRGVRAQPFDRGDVRWWRERMKGWSGSDWDQRAQPSPESK